MNKFLLILSSIFLIMSNVFANSDKSNNSPMSSILILVAFFAIFYFLFIRPQMKRNKDQRKMLSELLKGDEIIINSTFFGKIVRVKENYIEVEISNNIIVKVQKNSVSSVLPKGSIATN